MGYLHYGPSQIFRFDDRSLAHLRTVVVAKLIQQESFLFTWKDSGIRRSIWMHPAIPVQFEFDSTESPQLNRGWVEELMASANSTGGLKLRPEPAPGVAS